MAKPRILLTGSTGFVGRAVTAELLAGGYAIRHVIRTGSKDRILSLGPRDDVIETEDLFLRSPSWWADTVAGCDIILHLAWYAEPGKYQLSDKNLDCLTGTIHLAQGAMQAGVRRFVGVGTCLEYDLSQGNVHPDTALDPQSPYAAAKAACALSLGQMLPQAGTSFLWARLFYLFGAEEDDRRLTAYLHRQLAAGAQADLSDGAQVRDFMDVADAARLLVSDALSDRRGTSNICSGLGITVRALAERIADEYGRRDLLNFGARAANPDDPPVVIGARDIRDLKGPT